MPAERELGERGKGGEEEEEEEEEAAAAAVEHMARLQTQLRLAAVAATAPGSVVPAERGLLGNERLVRRMGRRVEESVEEEEFAADLAAMERDMLGVEGETGQSGGDPARGQGGSETSENTEGTRSGKEETKMREAKRPHDPPRPPRVVPNPLPMKNRRSNDEAQQGAALAASEMERVLLLQDPARDELLEEEKLQEGLTEELAEMTAHLRQSTLEINEALQVQNKMLDEAADEAEKSTEDIDRQNKSLEEYQKESLSACTSIAIVVGVLVAFFASYAVIRIF